MLAILLNSSSFSFILKLPPQAWCGLGEQSALLCACNLYLLCFWPTTPTFSAKRALSQTLFANYFKLALPANWTQDSSSMLSLTDCTVIHLATYTTNLPVASSSDMLDGRLGQFCLPGPLSRHGPPSLVLNPQIGEHRIEILCKPYCTRHVRTEWMTPCVNQTFIINHTTQYQLTAIDNNSCETGLKK